MQDLMKHQKNLMKNYKKDLRTYLSFLIMISINLSFCPKGIYPYEYMGYCEKVNEITLNGFYSNLNMGEIKDADYTLGKRLCKDFEIKI